MGVTMTRSHPDPVSSHVLDTSRGLPARGVRATMYRMGGEQVWTKLQSRATNDDGRASKFLSWDEFKPGTYKMHFATGEYFKQQKVETFYPYAEVVFEIKKSRSSLPCCPSSQSFRIFNISGLLSDN